MVDPVSETAPITRAELEMLQSLDRLATPGPWIKGRASRVCLDLHGPGETCSSRNLTIDLERSAFYTISIPDAHDPGEYELLGSAYEGIPMFSEANQDLIVTMRNLLPKLLSVIETSIT